MTNPYTQLSPFERILLGISTIIILGSFFTSPTINYLTIIASLIGVNALIFVAKGFAVGQILTIIFALFYGAISYFSSYYGEMITYLFMTSPIALIALISWVKNPYKASREVKIHKMTQREVGLMLVIAIVTTIIFFFILKALGTAQLFISTLSITTSFLASYLTYKRSPFYAVAYMANDLVLIVLWILATKIDKSYFPMITCFIVFFVNDLYGFYNWQRMKKRQLPDSHFEHYSIENL